MKTISYAENCLFAKNIYVDANGTYKTEISEEQQKTLQRLINWQYYKLFDEKNP